MPDVPYFHYKLFPVIYQSIAEEKADDGIFASGHASAHSIFIDQKSMNDRTILILNQLEIRRIEKTGPILPNESGNSVAEGESRPPVRVI